MFLNMLFTSAERRRTRSLWIIPEFQMNKYLADYQLLDDGANNLHLSMAPWFLKGATSQISAPSYRR
jgi:hypothetical protein